MNTLLNLWIQTEEKWGTKLYAGITCALIMGLCTISSMILTDLRLSSQIAQYDSAVQMEVKNAIFNHRHYFLGFITYFPVYFIIGVLLNRVSLYLSIPATILMFPSFLDIVISGRHFQDSECIVLSIIGNTLFYAYFLYRLLNKKQNSNTKIDLVTCGVGYGFFSATIIFIVLTIMGSG